MKSKVFFTTVVTLLCLLFISTAALAVTYRYDSFGRLSSVTYENGARIAYQYDAGGNLLSTIITTGHTGEETQLWPARRHVSPSRTWVIALSSPADPASVDGEHIYVTDTAGNKVTGISPALSADGLKISIAPPPGGYTPGETYQLHISDQIRSARGTSLERNIRMEFSIAE